MNQILIKISNTRMLELFKQGGLNSADAEKLLDEMHERGRPPKFLQIQLLAAAEMYFYDLAKDKLKNNITFGAKNDQSKD